MKYLVVTAALVQLVLCDVSHLIHYEEEITTPPPLPKPYAFGYAAGRFQGHIDRTHTEISDGEVVKGSYSYVDPHFKVRTVDYTADKYGFHPVLNTPQRPLPKDSAAVAAAKNKHLRQYAAIAQSHQDQDVQAQAALPADSASVAFAKAKHSDLFQKIAADHARIAAERAAENPEIEEPNHVDEYLRAPKY